MYTALYRKYRPKTFHDVVGQEHIVRTLQNQIKNNRISHAYLFCGTRGTGKTSVAKIFATAVNCASADDGEPCGNCKSCLDISNKQSVNLIEIDAASNNGVDNIRDIREEVKYPPVNGKYKVYIIDEVHMLSTGAFNALLKTLEEPPESIIFILATTDPQKIPATILSRCQRFDFKRIHKDNMFNKIKDYMQIENIDIDDEAINYIINLSGGAMRDALSILDQSISFYFGEKITLQKIQDILGAVDAEIYFEMINSIHKLETNNCLSIIEKVNRDGKDINQFLNDLLHYLRDLIVASSTNLNSDDFNHNNEQLKSLAHSIPAETLMFYIKTFSELQNQLKYAPNSKILLEVCCIKLCNPSGEKSNENLNARIFEIENKLESFLKNPPQIENKIKPEEKIKYKEKVVPEDIKLIKKTWKEIISKFDGITKEMLSISQIGFLEGKTLCIVTNDKSSALFLKQKENEVKAKISDELNKDLDIIFIDKDEYNLKHTKIYGVQDNDIFNNPNFDKINMEIKFE